MNRITIKKITVNERLVKCVFIDKNREKINLDNFNIELDQILNDLIDQKNFNIAISLKNVAYPGDLATATLVKFGDELRLRGSKLSLIDLDEDLKLFFNTLGWDKILDIN